MRITRPTSTKRRTSCSTSWSKMRYMSLPCLKRAKAIESITLMTRFNACLKCSQSLHSAKRGRIPNITLIDSHFVGFCLWLVGSSCLNRIGAGDLMSFCYIVVPKQYTTSPQVITDKFTFLHSPSLSLSYFCFKSCLFFPQFIFNT